MLEHLPGVHEALGSIPRITQKCINKKKIKSCHRAQQFYFGGYAPKMDRTLRSSLSDVFTLARHTVAKGGVHQEAG